jgi:hypothetical protein
LFKNNAKWHKTCRNKFTELKLDREVHRLKHYKNPGLVCSEVTPAKITRKSTEYASVIDKKTCFICNKSELQLHKVSTFTVDEKVRTSAHILQDTILLSKLASGDLISQDAVYHRSCLTNLYRRADSETQVNSENNEERVLHGIALAELIEFISESHEEKKTVFKLSDLSKLYSERLLQLGIDITTRVHSTRLKTRLMGHFKDMHAYNEGCDVYLAFNNDVGVALKRFGENIDYDHDAIILSKAANIVRRDIFRAQKAEFNGTFTETCQQDATPKYLQTLVEMILGASNIKNKHLK